MNAELKMQMLVIAASGVAVALLAALLVGVGSRVDASMSRYLVVIPPVGVAAYVFVFGWMRDLAGGMPARAEIIGGVAQATLATAGFFAVLTLTILLVVRLLSRFS